jgi:hypothetical protein
MDRNISCLTFICSSLSFGFEKKLNKARYNIFGGYDKTEGKKENCLFTFPFFGKETKFDIISCSHTCKRRQLKISTNKTTYKTVTHKLVTVLPTQNHPVERHKQMICMFSENLLRLDTSDPIQFGTSLKLFLAYGILRRTLVSSKPDRRIVFPPNTSQT